MLVQNYSLICVVQTANPVRIQYLYGEINREGLKEVTKTTSLPEWGRQDLHSKYQIPSYFISCYY
jgi:hypothetical protein